MGNSPNNTSIRLSHIHPIHIVHQPFGFFKYLAENIIYLFLQILVNQGWVKLLHVFYPQSID